MLSEQIRQLKEWIHRDLGQYRDSHKLLRTFEVETQSPLEGISRATFTLWTRRNRYAITLHAKLSPPGACYMGCGACSRSWRAGEDWHRGNDLPDGEFSETLWLRILTAILSYELDEPVEPREATLSPTVAYGQLKDEGAGRG